MDSPRMERVGSMCLPAAYSTYNIKYEYFARIVARGLGHMHVVYTRIIGY